MQKKQSISIPTVVTNDPDKMVLWAVGIVGGIASVLFSVAYTPWWLLLGIASTALLFMLYHSAKITDVETNQAKIRRERLNECMKQFAECV